MARTETKTDIEQFTDASQENRAMEDIRAENNAVAAADAVIMGSFDAIKALGRIEAANFFTTVGDKLIAETAIQIRESKKFKGLPYQDADGNLRHVVDFSEFCRQFLGRSYSRVMELIGNYNTLGSDLYEKAEKLGFRQRDYNALKALPSDDRQLIALAIEEENLDKALDLMQEMASKHQREKEEAHAQIADLKGNREAMERLIKNKNEKINELEHKLTRKQVDDAGLPQGYYELEALHTETQAITAKITAALNSRIVKLFDAFGGDEPAHVRLAAAQSIGLIITAAYELAADFGLQPETKAEEAADAPARREAAKLEALLADDTDPFALLDNEAKADLARLNSYKQVDIED
jgi:hypothetical protein